MAELCHTLSRDVEGQVFFPEHSVAHFEFHTDLAEKLPSNIRFGTSSWTYPGWQGSVYQEHYKNERDLKQRCLEEYSRFPWFRTVGIDSSFYAPPSESTLEHYASQVPETFKWVSKVWDEITVPRFAKHARYGKRAGLENENFLDAEMFSASVLSAYEAPEVRKRTGPFVFQFQALGRELTSPPTVFLEKLDSFLEELSKDFQYAVEIRNKELLIPEYFATLNRHGTAHCFNHWTSMPPLKTQMTHAALAGGLDAPFFVSRVLTPLGVSYASAVKRFQPYNNIKQPNQNMRTDLVRLARRAIKRNIPAFIIVNNRAEGFSPGTIDAIGTAVVESLEKDISDE